jgi:hypothetical protein
MIIVRILVNNILLITWFVTRVTRWVSNNGHKKRTDNNNGHTKTTDNNNGQNKKDRQ